MTMPRLRLGKRHMEIMRIVCADNHGHGSPSPEHRDLERWGYLTIYSTPLGWEYLPTDDGRNADRTWREMKEPD